MGRLPEGVTTGTHHLVFDVKDDQPGSDKTVGRTFSVPQELTPSIVLDLIGQLRDAHLRRHDTPPYLNKLFETLYSHAERICALELTPTQKQHWLLMLTTRALQKVHIENLYAHKTKGFLHSIRHPFEWASTTVNDYWAHTQPENDDDPHYRWASHLGFDDIIASTTFTNDDALHRYPNITIQALTKLHMTQVLCQPIFGEILFWVPLVVDNKTMTDRESQQKRALYLENYAFFEKKLAAERDALVARIVAKAKKIKTISTYLSSETHRAPNYREFHTHELSEYLAQLRIEYQDTLTQQRDSLERQALYTPEAMKALLLATAALKSGSGQLTYSEALAYLQQDYTLLEKVKVARAEAIQHLKKVFAEAAELSDSFFSAVQADRPEAVFPEEFNFVLLGKRRRTAQLQYEGINLALVTTAKRVIKHSYEDPLPIKMAERTQLMRTFPNSPQPSEAPAPEDSSGPALDTADAGPSQPTDTSPQDVLEAPDFDAHITQIAQAVSERMAELMAEAQERYADKSAYLERIIKDVEALLQHREGQAQLASNMTQALAEAASTSIVDRPPPVMATAASSPIPIPQRPTHRRPRNSLSVTSVASDDAHSSPAAGSAESLASSTETLTKFMQGRDKYLRL